MQWFWLALLAPAIYAVINFLDKYVVSEKVQDSRIIPMYSSVAAFLFGSGLWWLMDMPLLGARDTVIILLTGVFSLYGLIFYFKALSKSETSSVIILAQMVPVISLILSFLFLGETITAKQFLGFFVVLCAAVVLSVSDHGHDEDTASEKKTGFHLNDTFYLILIVDVLFALSNVLIKFTLSENSFTDILIYESFGMFLGGFSYYVFFSSARKSFHESLLSVGPAVLCVMAVSEIVFITAKSVTFLAISLGPVALVSVLGSTQLFYSIIYGLVLTLLWPSIFREDISKRGLLVKTGIGAVLIFGLWLTR